MHRLSESYLAGIFDGEGCVRIQINKWNRSAYKKLNHPCYQLMVSIVVTDETVIDLLHQKFGGCKSKNIHLNPKHKPCYHWIIASRKAYHFLKSIHPYTIIKNEQIKIALEFQEHIFECGRESWNRTKRLSPEIIQYRHSCYQRLKDLKIQI